MHKRRKFIISSLILLLLFAAGTAYYLYNKPGVNVQDATGLKIAATELYATYVNDTTLAKTNFNNHILDVSGIVNNVTANQQKQPVILLTTATTGAAINCTLEGKVPAITTGTAITIRGICNGMGAGDADLGIMGDVYLVRCYVVKTAN